MELTGERRIPASRDVVWAALNDPEILRTCVPGCESLAREADGTLVGAALVEVGPVTARYAIRLQAPDANPPHEMEIVGEAQGGGSGFANGSATVRLTEAGALTTLGYGLRAQGGGRVAQLGSRAIEAAANGLVREFLDRFVDAVGGSPRSEVAAAGTAGVLAAVGNAASAPGGQSTMATMLARVPTEPYGLPLIGWIGMAICAFLAVMIFKGYLGF